jgi:signal peptidase II
VNGDEAKGSGVEMTVRRTIVRLWIPMMLALVVIALDQLTKVLVVQTWPVPLTGEFQLLGDWLSFTYLRNSGIAFGLFQGVPHVFTVTSLAITAGAVRYYLRHVPETHRWASLILGLVTGGALSNVIDRIRLGYVVDWIKTFAGYFPLFNLADSAVVVGIALLALTMFVDDHNHARLAKSEVEGHTSEP